MKYCLSNRQPMNILKKADQIRVEMRDYRALSDYIEKFPDKDIIFEINNGLPEGLEWKSLMAYAEKTKGKFYCCVDNIEIGNICKSLNLPFYYKYPVTSFYELHALADLKVSFVLIGIPLIFELDKVVKYKIPIRVIPNIAYEDYLPHENGLHGQWIRPENIQNYEKYVSYIDFQTFGDLKKEETLYHIYAENKIWPGNLKLLVDNLNVDVENQGIYNNQEFAEKRMVCGQICEKKKDSCHFCDNICKFSPLVYKAKVYKDKKT